MIGSARPHRSLVVNIARPAPPIIDRDQARKAALAVPGEIGPPRVTRIVRTAALPGLRETGAPAGR
jgi:hypothetical protein